MDQVWNRGDFEEFLHQKDQQQVDQIDLSCMINDFLPNEQYPYNMGFQESLTELSPESQILLEDAVSMGSSQSPLSEDYSSCNISAQNSPLSNGEEYLYNNGISFDVKQEKISPKNSLVDMIGNTSFDDLLLSQQQPTLIPTLQQINIEKNDFQMYLEPPAKKTPDRFSGFTPQQLKPEEKATEGFRFGVNDNQGIKFTNGNADSCLAQVLQEAADKGMLQEQKQNVVELLKKNYVNDMQKGKKQSQNKEQKAKKASKSRKQKKEQQNGQKMAQTDNVKERNPALEETVPAKSQTDVSKTLPQVVMIPQVVFTTGNCQTVTTQPAVTAYLTSSNKTAMTALPIKIVSANSSEVDKIPINPLGKRHNEAMISKKHEKGERKTNHNEVEKRYRKSITSSLEELKDLVFGSETRSTKAGILRKAMDHIKHLRKINQRLKQENMQLKMAQKQTSLVDLVKNNMNTNNVMQSSTEDFNEPFSSEDDDLPMSDEDDMLSVDEDSESKSESSPSIESVQGSAFSMMNKQRFFLSMFMFAFMFLGPSKLLFGSDSKGSSVDYTSPHAGGRTILSVNTNEEDGFKGYTKLIVNCILYLLFFAWLLIKGEPRYPRGCKQLSLFKTFLKKADNEMKQGDFTTASVYIERGLQVIGRPLSLSKTDMIPSLFWHSLCHMLHQIGILPMLKYLGWLILPRRLSLNEAVHRYRSSCLLAAEAYSKLLDLSLLDPEKRKNSLLCAKLSMAAINMAENAESLAGNELLTKVYINTVALLRMKIGKPAYPFMNFYINRAKSAFSGYANDTPRALNWISHPAGKSFILSGDWDMSYKKNSFKDPLRMIGYQYLMYQVKITLKHIMAPTAPVMNVQGTENELSVLKQLSQDGDSVAKWWYSVIAPIFYIQYGMKDKATQAWNTEFMSISPESNPLACDLYDIVECYFNIDDGIEREELEERLQIAEDHLLRNFIFEQGKGSKDELFELLAYACAEMALIVRVEHWETSSSGMISVEQLTKFEQDLNILRELSNRTSMVSHKVEHYNKILRVMVGSNPIHLTKQLLAKKKRQQVRDNGPDERPVDIEEIQEAKTLLFVFKHLSEVISKYCPKGCINHLQNAGLALERCGMLEMTEDCKKLLATLQTT